ncbi:hypothetical protein LSAT2_023864 [Lamellibrachia satsuma]|nr:hypothetical protein LSAT2_023864 [Lamellibrachia satsuma]
MLGYRDMEAKKGRDRLIQNAKKHIQCSQLPLLSFPEGASTNGHVGLLKFSVWPFSIGCPVQPVVVEVKRPPFANISPSILGGRWWIDIFWFLFVPYTHFRIRAAQMKEADCYFLCINTSVQYTPQSPLAIISACDKPCDVIKADIILEHRDLCFGH